MRRIDLFRLAGTAAALLALGAVSAPSAGARATLTPASQNFGSVPLGGSSGPMSYTLTVTCNAEEPGCPPDPVHPDPVVGPNTPDWSVSHNCPMLMPGNSAMGTSCTVDITFTPIAPGSRGALLSSGAYLTPEPPELELPGPSAEAFGFGVCSPSTCFPGALPGGGPSSNQSNLSLPNATSDSKKKCKKKKTKAARKKCKKKKRT